MLTYFPEPQNLLRNQSPRGENSLLRILSLPLIQAAAGLLLIGSLSGQQAQASSLTTPFANLNEIATGVGLNAYRDLASRTLHPVKVAILDNGFRNYSAELGKTLPSSTVFHAGPVAVDAATEESHGLFMAQLVTGLLDRADGGEVPYQLHLFSTFGYSNLKAAVDTVVKEKFDIVLYSQVWEYGGNSDGRGFINSLVSQAVSSGALWINAAGNFGDATFRTSIERTTDDWAKLPGPNNSVRVRCLPNPAKANKQAGDKAAKCDLRAVLSWNDFSDDVTQGSDKDLDFVLTDDTLQVIQSSGLKQKKQFPEGEAGSSLYSREIIQAQVSPGLYYLRVKMRSDNFNKLQDELRITTSGDLVKQLDLSPSDETILPPADNAGVITVGASDSEKSAAARHLGKPELLFPSAVKLTAGDEYRGSSNSAAIAAAAATVLKSLVPALNRRGLLMLLTPARHGDSSQTTGQDGNENQSWTSYGRGLPITALQFRATGPGCFQIARLPYIPQAAVALLRAGAVTVLTDHGVKIMTPMDPFTMVETGTRRQRADDLLAVGAQGFFVVPRVNQLQLDPSNFEVVQLPQANMICQLDGSRPNGAVPPANPSRRKPRERQTHLF